MKINILFICILLTAIQGYSQQEPCYGIYMFNHFAYNPGFAGTNNEISATAINRQQWAGFDGAPNTMGFSVEGLLKPFGVKSGIGVNLVQDKQGLNTSFQLEAAYSYRTELAGGKLGIGLSLGLINLVAKGEFKAVDGAEQDMAIPPLDQPKSAFNMNFGAFYKASNYYVGLSSTRLNEGNFKFVNQEGNDILLDYLKRHYYLTGGYRFRTKNPLIEIQPSSIIRFDGRTMQADINALGYYNKKFWGGLGYRIGANAIIIAGLELINGIKLSLAYELTTSKMIKGSPNTFEVLIQYGFKLSMDKTPDRYRSVRFL